MIKKYIVLTADGFTEDVDMESTENLQVIDWIEGNNISDAFENFKKQKKYYGNYDQLCIQEVVGDLIYLDYLCN